MNEGDALRWEIFWRNADWAILFLLELWMNKWEKARESNSGDKSKDGWEKKCRKLILW